MASLTPCPHYIGKGMPSWCLLGACAQPETHRLRQKMSRSFADWMLASPDQQMPVTTPSPRARAHMVAKCYSAAGGKDQASDRLFVYVPR
jgi:hypothetical protein